MQVYPGKNDGPSGQGIGGPLRWFAAGNLAIIALMIGCAGEPALEPTAQPVNVAAADVAPPAVAAVAPSAEPTTPPLVEGVAEPVAEGASEAEATAEPSDAPTNAPVEPPIEASEPLKPAKLPPPDGAQRLSPDHDIWLRVDKGELIIDGNVSLRRGVLEMFACTRNSKEHESILSANTMAFTAHAGLLRLGAKPGSPVQWDPEYAAPTGDEIAITLQWPDPESGKMQTARAQDWVREVDSGKPMEQPFVFAGSFFEENAQTGERAYMAEWGDFICVSNFSTAMLDVPAPSSQSQEGLLFEAYTERIPPLGAPVRMILKKAESGQ